jgi:3',5'-cyclic AMP phosphodiesterase CpdA
MIRHIALATVGAAVVAASGASMTTRLAMRDTIPVIDSVVVVLAAGDIAACTAGSVATAQLLDSLPGQILVAGDAAYASRQNPDPYKTCYDTTWGRHKARTRAVPGNHDAEPGVIKKFYAYFGDAAAAPLGYYSFDIGAWHVIGINSNIDLRPRSPQGRWLAADLAKNTAKCTLAFMHHPRFSSGPHSLRRYAARAIFGTLREAGVDVLIAGHDHIYERFAPMDEDGKLLDSGIRQFIVGTGGNGLYPISRKEPNSEVRSDQDLGVLKLTLRPNGYDWEFVPIVKGFVDSGSATCH